MAEMTREQVRQLTLEDIAEWFSRANDMDASNVAITWEHGTDLVNIVANHGHAIARVLLAQRKAPSDGEDHA